MNAALVRAELEEELTKRLDELRFFKNFLSECSGDADRERYCKALVVMLYAHFEGFWKAAFSIYARAINREGIKCVDAADAIAAASLDEIFLALTDASRKCDLFRNSAPDDSKLHRFARHIEFAGRVKDFQDLAVSIPVEKVINTESNLTPVVVRKNLYRLGFAHDELQDKEGAVKWLVDRRNDVAHGSARLGITEKEFVDVERAITSLMNDVVVLLFEAIRQQRFLRAAAGGAA